MLLHIPHLHVLLQPLLRYPSARTSLFTLNCLESLPIAVEFANPRLIRLVPFPIRIVQVLAVQVLRLQDLVTGTILATVLVARVYVKRLILRPRLCHHLRVAWDTLHLVTVGDGLLNLHFNPGLLNIGRIGEPSLDPEQHLVLFGSVVIRLDVHVDVISTLMRRLHFLLASPIAVGVIQDVLKPGLFVVNPGVERDHPDSLLVHRARRGFGGCGCGRC
jgi:hypothetical protein